MPSSATNANVNSSPALRHAEALAERGCGVDCGVGTACPIAGDNDEGTDGDDGACAAAPARLPRGIGPITAPSSSVPLPSGMLDLRGQ